MASEHPVLSNSFLPSLIVERLLKSYSIAWETLVRLRYSNVGKRCLAFEIAVLLSLTMSFGGRGWSTRVVDWRPVFVVGALVVLT